MLPRRFSRAMTIRPLKSTYPSKFWTSIRTLKKRLKRCRRTSARDTKSVGGAASPAALIS
jgi:hypothetical protein